MATHDYPDGTKPLRTFINDKRLYGSATTAEEIMGTFPALRISKVQYKPIGLPDTAWYVVFKDLDEPYLINMRLNPSNVVIEFRFSQYLPLDVFESLQWQNSSWRYADLKKQGIVNLKKLMFDYIESLKEDCYNGKLKNGGQSFAEKVMYWSLQKIFSDTKVYRNIRLDAMRSSKGYPLELDLYIPDEKLAIEIQGPRHFSEDRVKVNDQFKVEWCKSNGIKLIWMNWDAINKELLKSSFVERTRYLNDFLAQVKKQDEYFVWWKGK